MNTHHHLPNYLIFKEDLYSVILYTIYSIFIYNTVLNTKIYNFNNISMIHEIHLHTLAPVSRCDGTSFRLCTSLRVTIKHVFCCDFIYYVCFLWKIAWNICNLLEVTSHLISKLDTVYCRPTWCVYWTIYSTNSECNIKRKIMYTCLYLAEHHTCIHFTKKYEVNFLHAGAPLCQNSAMHIKIQLYTFWSSMHDMQNKACVFMQQN